VISYRINHITTYNYSEPVTLCHNEAHLLPGNFGAQRTIQSSLRIDPAPHSIQDREDFYGNRVTYFALEEAHSSLVVHASSEVIIRDEAPPDIDRSMPWEEVKKRFEKKESLEEKYAADFMFPSPMVAVNDKLKEYILPIFTKEKPFLLCIKHFNEKIYKEFKYSPSSTTIFTPLMEVLEKKQGVCQDFAHIAIGCLRSLGFPARYVSGYMETIPPPGQAKLRGADASHAWFSVLDPVYGWVDFDPTNNTMIGNRHIINSFGRDYSDVTPLKGIVFGGGKHSCTVSVDVERR